MANTARLWYIHAMKHSLSDMIQRASAFEILPVAAEVPNFLSELSEAVRQSADTEIYENMKLKAVRTMQNLCEQGVGDPVLVGGYLAYWGHHTDQLLPAEALDMVVKAFTAYPANRELATFIDGIVEDMHSQAQAAQPRPSSRPDSAPRQPGSPQ